ncbi:MAG: hypothetical protein JO322_08825 [Candidatus Eremiobacteraeota bacterium]|nr:hypothetical protein [Candidatus Eremiobacteraeota bacterium]
MSSNIRRIKAVVCCAILAASAACSGQSGMTPSGETPGGGSVTAPAQVSKSATVSKKPQLNLPQSAFLKSGSPNPLVKARALHASAVQKRPMGAPVCLSIASGNFAGFTAAVILTGTQVQTTDVDGTGCDIGIYAAPGANAVVDSINIRNANAFLVVVDEGAALRIGNTDFYNDANPAFETILSYGTFKLFGSTVRHDGFEAAVDVEDGTTTIRNSTVRFGIDQVGVIVNGGTADINNSDVLYKPLVTVGDFILPIAVLSEIFLLPNSTANVRNETIRIGDGGAGVIYSFGAGGEVHNSLINGPNALYGIRLIDQAPVKIDDTTIRMTGASRGIYESCDTVFPSCAPFTIANSTSSGDGNVGSIGYGFFSPGFTLYQDVSRRNGTGYITYCVPGFNTLTDLTTFLAAGGNIARHSTVADAAVITNPANCVPPFP